MLSFILFMWCYHCCHSILFLPFQNLSLYVYSVAHPYLVVHSKRDANRAAASAAQTITNGRTDCALCHEPPTQRVISSCCQTQFCKLCVIDYMETAIGNNDGVPCPQCREPFSINLNEVHEDTIADATQNGECISTIGLPSLKDLPHVSSGKYLFKPFVEMHFPCSKSIVDLTKCASLHHCRFYFEAYRSD